MELPEETRKRSEEEVRQLIRALMDRVRHLERFEESVRARMNDWDRAAAKERGES